MARKSIKNNTDPQAAANNTYNDMAGGQKNIDIGPKLLPINFGSGSETCDATTARQCIAGASLAVYNTSATLYSITFGQTSAVGAAASGTVVAGNASLPCQGNTWSYFAAGQETWFITNNAALLVFIIADDTKL